MKTYTTQAEVDADVKNGQLLVNDDVTFKCSVIVDGDITVRGNITALDTDAYDITAYDITAHNIDAYDIDARDISYYAFCIVYGFITCTSIKGTRANHHPPICLDGILTIKYKLMEDK